MHVEPEAYLIHARHMQILTGGAKSETSGNFFGQRFHDPPPLRAPSTGSSCVEEEDGVPWRGGRHADTHLGVLLGGWDGKYGEQVGGPEGEMVLGRWGGVSEPWGHRADQSRPHFWGGWHKARRPISLPCSCQGLQG